MGLGLATLSKSLYTKINEKRGKVALFPLNPDDTIAQSTVSHQALVFQYFPESISDSYATNYQPKEIFGGSTPLLQYTGGGTRTISFTAIFTSDLDMGDEDVAAGASDASVQQRSVDIRVPIAILRSYQLPQYKEGKTLPPPKLVLNITNSGIGVTGGWSDIHQYDNVLCVLTNTDVTWEAYYPDNSPRIASVNLTFITIPQFQGGIYFPKQDVRLSDFVQGFSGNARPYRIQYDTAGLQKLKDAIKKPGQ